jgi:NAD(P)-dependent dehydrogenase (short-subunit alcohol dehydrogenase family)
MIAQAPHCPQVFWTERSLSVLVPALNEEENLKPTLERLLKALSITAEDFEIIIINDGSSDGTGVVADRLAAAHPQVRVIHHPQPLGLGSCYQQGVDEARKNFFVYIPGDNTWPYRSLLELFGNLGKADVVTSYTTNPCVRPFGRRVVSALYTRTLNFLFRRRMRYYNGLTIYPLSFLRANSVSTSGFGFQAETLLRALYQGLSVVEVALPIDERMAGGSKAVNLKNIVSVLGTVIRLFWRLRVRGVGSTQEAEKYAPGAKGWGASASNPAVEEVGLRGDAASLQAPFTPWKEERGAPLTPSGPLRIVLTGASSGIGAALTRSLAEDGHQLFVCARRLDRLNQVTQDNTLALGWACDVSDEAQVKRFLERVREVTPQVDALVNCAGTFGAIGPIETTDSQEWLDTFRVNLFGVYLLIKFTLPLLLDAPSPRIINVAGGGAFSPFPNYSAYGCSKAALVRLTECVAAELAPRGVAVNALAPGIVATEAHQATLRAGEDRAGTLHYRRTLAVMNEGGAPIANVIDCLKALLSPQMQGLTAKTISANFDPWCTRVFQERIRDITRSDLYTSRRYNIVNLPAGSLRDDLGKAWANYATQT